MRSITISSLVFACVFGGALLGLLLRRLLPDGHLTSDAKDVIKLSTGLVSTMAALVLGLLVASAKSSYDAQSTELTQLSANVIMLDRILARYGSDAQGVRDLLRASVQRGIDRLWPPSAGSHADLAPMAVGDTLQDRLLALSPQDDPHRALKAQALAIASSGGQTRWLMYEQGATSVSLPLLVVLVLWLSVIFISFGLFSPTNPTVVASLLVSALSVSGAIFLILEMYSPYEGVIQISSAPLRAALAHLGQ